MDLRRLPSIGNAPETLELPLPFPGAGYLSFGSRRGLDDERVRRALAHGLERARLTQDARFLPAHGGLLPPAVPGHSHDLALRFDLDRARALLAEAGYPDGRGLPELRLLHVDLGFSEEYRRDQEVQWQQWCDLGVRLRQEWHVVAGDSTDFSWVAEADLFEWAWDADYPDPHGMLGSLLDTVPVSRDAETERLVAQAGSLRARDERIGLYREADRRLVADQVRVVPTYYGSRHLVYRPWLEGVWASPVAISPLSDIVVRRAIAGEKWWLVPCRVDVRRATAFPGRRASRQLPMPYSRSASLRPTFRSVDSPRRPMISAQASWYVPAGNSFGRVPGTTTERGGT